MTLFLHHICGASNVETVINAKVLQNSNLPVDLVSVTGRELWTWAFGSDRSFIFLRKYFECDWPTVLVVAV